VTGGAPAGGAGSQPTDEFSVFLNIPYDRRFSKLCLAYIAGITCFGLRPRATLELPGGERRLDRIMDLIRTCDYSVHDLSRVQLNREHPPTPRFNMPFELGLAVAMAKSGTTNARQGNWFVFEALQRRVHKSLSDLDGTEVYIHGGTVRGVFGQLANAFVRAARQPTVQEMDTVFQKLERAVPAIKRDAGSSDLFATSVFSKLVVAARTVVDARMQQRGK
jgi:hypothetical protein